jgi:hypothetical protein
MTKISKKLTIIGFLIILVIGCATIAFLPFLDIRSAIGLDDPRYKTQEIVVNSYNPISPRISLITKVEDGYIVTVEDYQRSGISTFSPTGKVNGLQKGTGFDQLNSKITGKTLEEAKQIAATQDQSKTPFTPEKSQIEKDYIEEQKKPVECQKVIRDENKYSDSFILSIYKDMKYLDFLKLRLVTGEEFKNSQGIYFISVNSNQNNIIKYNIYGEKETYDQNPDIKITKIEKVYSDCHTEEIPLPEKSQ